MRSFPRHPAAGRGRPAPEVGDARARRCAIPLAFALLVAGGAAVAQAPQASAADASAARTAVPSSPGLGTGLTGGGLGFGHGRPMSPPGPTARIAPPSADGAAGAVRAADRAGQATSPPAP
jgi:hypothetical protein